MGLPSASPSILSSCVCSFGRHVVIAFSCVTCSLAWLVTLTSYRNTCALSQRMGPGSTSCLTRHARRRFRFAARPHLSALPTAEACMLGACRACGSVLLATTLRCTAASSPDCPRTVYALSRCDGLPCCRVEAHSQHHRLLECSPVQAYKAAGGLQLPLRLSRHVPVQDALKALKTVRGHVEVTMASNSLSWSTQPMLCILTWSWYCADAPAGLSQGRGHRCASYAPNRGHFLPVAG